MSANVQFNDGSAGTLTAGVPRFGNWTPNAVDVGDRRSVLSGAVHKFVLRTDYTALFEVSNLKPSDLPVALRLMRHLTGGGSITVNTDDNAARTYTATLRPESEPTLEFTDRLNLEYTLRLEVRNAAAAPMICDYT